MVTRLTVVGTGLIGASIGLAAKERGARVLGWDRRSRTRSRPRASAARSTAPPTSLEEALDGRRARGRGGADRRAAGRGRGGARGGRRGDDRHGRRLDEGERGRGGGRLARGSSAAIRSAAPRRAAPSTRPPGSSPARRGSSRRRRRPTPSATASSTAFVAELGAVPVAIDPAAHDRLVAMTSHLPHVLANVVVNQAGAARDRGPRAARERRRLAARHDARRGREPAHLGRHPPRQRRRGPRGARRAPPPRSSRSRRRSTHGDAGFLARWIGEAARQPPADARQRVRRRRRAAPRARPRPRPAGRVRRRSRRRSAPSGSTSTDFELQHISPERGGTVTLLVTGEGEARRAAELLESAGLRRRRLRGAR